MTDLVNRLRGAASCPKPEHVSVKLYDDAADEIERLRWWLRFIKAQTRTEYGTTAALTGRPIPTSDR